MELELPSETIITNGNILQYDFNIQLIAQGVLEGMLDQ